MGTMRASAGSSTSACATTVPATYSGSAGTVQAKAHAPPAAAVSRPARHGPVPTSAAR